jgi:pyruvate dehydrogenase E2 component (dihydrolipoamide acetyltransferase)
LAAQMPGKQIARSDVERFAGVASHAAPQTRVTVAPGDKPLESQIPFTQVRRIVADRMATSAHTAAPVTLNTEADATELVSLRARLKAEAEVRKEPAPSYNDLLTKIVARALIDHPALNARLEGDSIVTSPAVHIGLAVDTERGLLVPVLRDAHTKSVLRIAQESAPLIERARSGRVGPDDLRGGTFTITNLGMYEIDTFTPIINLPECAILGIGRILAKLVVVNAQNEYQVRQMVALSLTFDHRVVDGAPAARFLQQIKHDIERPYWSLLS